ncbi:MAG TPA: hypothetical protein VH542_12020 [Steroidobacteraceae bacterium]|jgi:hypothetical protein
MRPLTVLIGIILGSSVAIALGLTMVLIVFLILAGDEPQLRTEFRPLLQSAAVFAGLAAVAAASFAASLRQLHWRRWAIGALWTSLILVTWLYWPRTL